MLLYAKIQVIEPRPYYAVVGCPIESIEQLVRSLCILSRRVLCIALFRIASLIGYDERFAAVGKCERASFTLRVAVILCPKKVSMWLHTGAQRPLSLYAVDLSARSAQLQFC